MKALIASAFVAAALFASLGNAYACKSGCHCHHHHRHTVHSGTH
ncbi:MAG TPA: hypothetical protein VGK90_11985 [Rhizomicrobium sp.]|jgi:hypothetical protein